MPKNGIENRRPVGGKVEAKPCYCKRGKNDIGIWGCQI